MNQKTNLLSTTDESLYPDTSSYGAIASAPKAAPRMKLALPQDPDSNHPEDDTSILDFSPTKHHPITREDAHTDFYSNVISQENRKGSNPFASHSYDEYSSHNGAYEAPPVEIFGVEMRHAFVRKVFMLLLIQLILTGTIIWAFTTFPVLTDRSISHSSWIPTLAFGGSIWVILTISCCPRIARSFPGNYVLLLVLTLTQGVLLGTLSLVYTSQTILAAVGVTASLVLVLVLFAMQTRFDFTGWAPYLTCALWALLVWAAVVWLMGVRLDQSLYACVSAALFSIYLVADVQTIIGGKHRQFEYDTDDYVFACVSIYLDVVNLLVNMLAIIGGRRD